MKNKRFLLIGFYNEKALGVRYLSNALRDRGYEPYIIYFKVFHSSIPKKATKRELKLLCDLIEKIDPFCIGLSVMSSLYLESIYMVNRAIRARFSIPIVWGGVYATLEAQRAARNCDCVIRGEGEHAIVALADALQKGLSFEGLPNAAFYNSEGKFIQNDVLPLQQCLDDYGYPPIGVGDMYLIDDDKVSQGDPQLQSFTYELGASRGCPFSCTYCSAVNLRRAYTGKGRYVRFRSVDSVIQELREAKRKMPHLRIIHFWDEIFSDEREWIETFARRYQKEIGLPFRIWGHPLHVNERNITLLVWAGLYQISLGIQSGSARVRTEVFHRRETQGQIIEASRVLSRCGVPQVIYDFMLCHPFETQRDLEETFQLCLQLQPPFRLNIHGLNFLPGTDIVEMAKDEGIYNSQQLEEMMYSSIQQQYDQYWGPNAKAYRRASARNTWVELTYLTQFPQLRSRVEGLAQRARQGKAMSQIHHLKQWAQLKDRLDNLAKKVRLALGLQK